MESRVILPRRSVPLAFFSTWASAQQQIYSGFHKESSCPSGLTLFRQDISSEGDPVTEEGKFDKILQFEAKLCFVFFKKQMGIEFWSVSEDIFLFAPRFPEMDNVFISVGRVKKHKIAQQCSAP